jgi:hypothetical protein
MNTRLTTLAIAVIVLWVFTIAVERATERGNRIVLVLWFVQCALCAYTLFVGGRSLGWW